MKYHYAAEKFSAARRYLMLPHPQGEAEAIMRAFHECSLGLNNLDKKGIDEYAVNLIEKLEEFMNTDGLNDPNRSGLWTIKAEQLSIDDKMAVSRLVDELAYIFDQNNS
jgi:hypothetical protein